MSARGRAKEKIQFIRNAKQIWWAPAVDRWHNQTGVAHAVFEGGALCGAAPFSTGGSFPSAEQGGAHECRRCRKIITRAQEAQDHV